VVVDQSRIASTVRLTLGMNRSGVHIAGMAVINAARGLVGMV
jgi:hypothetical protein